MSAHPACILYTQDADLARRLKAFLRVLAEVRHVSEASRLDAVLQQTIPAVLLLDLRALDARNLLDEVQTEWKDVVIIALGTPRSEPLRELEESGVYAAEDLDLDRRHFQALVARAFDHLRLLQENRELRESATSMPLAPPLTAPGLSRDRYASTLPWLRFPRVFRRFDSLDASLASVVESVADTTSVTRVGIFARSGHRDQYRLRAGLRCLPETYEAAFGERDPLVRWFEQHAHLIARANLVHVADSAQRTVMRRALDTFRRGSHRAAACARPRHRLALLWPSAHRPALRLPRARESHDSRRARFYRCRERAAA
jgi:hypothetical protein